MSRALGAALLVIAAVGAGAQTAAPAATDPAKAPTATRQLTLNNKPWPGDFDAMLERRLIRVYAPYSRSLYFIDKGRERGLGVTAERIGIETTTYVRNIFKYYVSYRLLQDAGARAAALKESVVKPK